MFFETLTRLQHCFSEDSETVARLSLIPSSTEQGDLRCGGVAGVGAALGETPVGGELPVQIIDH